MPATKITINNNGNIRVEGDFEIVDPQGKPFGLGSYFPSPATSGSLDYFQICS